MIPIFKPGYLYHCVWKHATKFYYVNYIMGQSEPGVVYGRCVDSNDADYLSSFSTHAELAKWTLERIGSVVHSITELGHIDDFPEYLI